MASIQSNSGETGRTVFSLATMLNFRNRVPGASKRIGDALIDVAVDRIEDRSVREQQGPGGSTWAPLSDRTVERKAKLGLDPRINIETFEMLTERQIRGQTSVSRDVAVTIAGLDEETKIKIDAAHTATANRPARPFEDLGPEGERDEEQFIENVITSTIKAAGGP